MTNSRLMGRTLLGATALAAATFTTPVAAQRIDNIVAFGDSYADDGNLFQIIGFNAFGRLLELRPDLRRSVRFLAFLDHSRFSLTWHLLVMAEGFGVDSPATRQ